MAKSTANSAFTCFVKPYLAQLYSSSDCFVLLNFTKIRLNSAKNDQYTSKNQNFSQLGLLLSDGMRGRKSIFSAG